MEVSKRQLQDEEVTAYHGTPHSFDKFSTQYMGSGEGNQSFGWGLYFTDLEDIAKNYADRLSNWNTEVFVDGKSYFNSKELFPFAKNTISRVKAFRLIKSYGNIAQAISIYKKREFQNDIIANKKVAEEVLNLLESLSDKKVETKNEGRNLYKVTLHKGKTPEQYTWLEWDKPLINETKKDLILNNLPNNAAKRNKVENLKNNINKNGSQIYQMLSDIFNSDKKASLFLLRVGIDGIKYPTDSLSRGATSYNTSGFNYVVFDENAVNIEKQTQFEAMEISKKDLENQKVINQAHKDITKTKGKDYAPNKDEIQKWINDNPQDVEEITKGELEEEKKKGDRCTRIAKRKYDVWPSAYASGAVVKCRQGKIWKGLNEEDEELDEKWSEKYKRSIDCNNPKGFSQKAHCKGRLKEEENFGSDDINLSGHKNYTDWVIVHRNLNKPPYFSIKKSNGSKKIGDVIGYDTSILLKDVKFIILKSGQERARIEQTKNVHGGAVGKIVDSGGNYNTNGWTLVTYNPYTDDTFIEVETGEPIYNAKEAVLKNTREIWVKKEDSLNEKTDFSKEKEQGLHGWFARQGGKGKSKGWVDCNTCRNGKCKSCGRKEGESRSKYPACRPTPSACKTRGKGKSWGKKSKTNEEFPIQSLYREKENMEIKKKDIFDEDLVLKRDQSKKAIYVQSDLDSDKARSQETFKNKEALKSAGFKWDGDIKSWKTDDVNFMLAKKTIETINKKEFLIDTLEQLEEIVASSENTPEKETLMSKIDMYINDLSNATDEAAMSAEIRRYLSFFSKFRGHSLFNTWLIYIQSKGKATKVAGFRQWETKFHRRVKKGAKGLQIFVPIFTKSTSKDDETGEEITKENAVRFRPGYVFDIADTEPIDERGEVPETPNWFADLEPTERSIELYKYFIELCEDMGIEISKSGSERGEKGYSAGNKINISSAKEGAGEVSTLVHEIAHELMHWKKSSIYYQENTNAELRELQAESVSYVVLKHYDLPVEHHPTYLALWKANKDKIKENVNVITNVAKFIITEIDKIEKRHQNPNQNELNEQTKQDIENELKLNEIKNLFKRHMGKL